MEKYFNNETYSDIKIRLIDPDQKEIILTLHKVILAGSGEFFDRMFRVEMSEIKEETIRIDVSDLEIAVKLLKWIYSGEKFHPIETDELAKQWLIGDDLRDIEYPGPRGRFMKIHNTWYEADRNILIKKYIIYKSNSASSVRQITFNGSSRKEVTIHIEYLEENAEKLKRYLSGHNIRI